MCQGIAQDILQALAQQVTGTSDYRLRDTVGQHYSFFLGRALEIRVTAQLLQQRHQVDVVVQRQLSALAGQQLAYQLFQAFRLPLDTSQVARSPPGVLLGKCEGYPQPRQG